MIKDSKTAILIFAHSAAYEAKIKTFQNSKAVFESLQKRTVQLVQNTQLPFFLFTEQNQVGDSFAERFVNAIQSVYDLGYQSVITIGNDTPQLTSKQLLKAHEELLANHSVIGKSKDGGFYLLGIKKEDFQPELLLQLPWQKQTLSASLCSFLELKSISVTHLKTLADLDTYNDIFDFVNSFKKVYATLNQLLNQLVFEANQIITHVVEKRASVFLTYRFNKGSPLVY